MEIYLDYAAATPLDPRVKKAMEPYFSKEYGNPSSIHEKGRRAKEAIEDARKKVAAILHCKKNEVIFTAGGTEAENVAVQGVAKAHTGAHLITTPIEHHATLRTFEQLEKEGRSVSYMPVGRYGIVDSKIMRTQIRPDTMLVSVMYANNEIGTIEPIADIGKEIKTIRETRKKEGNPMPLYFHTDAQQAALFCDIDVQKLCVDLMSLNGGKIYGPKGIGALFVRANVEIQPIIYGGGQENGMRSGTENVPGIVGFVRALEIAEKERGRESARLLELREYFIQKLQEKIPEVIINGHSEKRLPNNVNISIPGIDGETAVIYLSERDVYCSTGSACSSTSLDPSHVILALGKSQEDARSSLRFTLGRSTVKKDIMYAVKAICEVVGIL